MTQEELQETIEAHQDWLSSGGKEGIRADFSGMDLSGQDLSDVDFRRAIFTATNLSDADLTDANLSEAWLEESNLRGADLTRTDFSHANLKGADLQDADMEDTVFSHADLSSVSLLRANVNDTKFNGADLSYAVLSKLNLSGEDFSRATLVGVNLAGINLSGADLTGADLSKSNLESANLSEADLSGADLSRCNLSESNVAGADLYETDFTASIAFNVNFDEAKQLYNAVFVASNLSGSSFHGQQLQGSKFTRATLKSVDFVEADARRVDFFKADLEQAYFRSADLSGAQFVESNLRYADLASAKLNVANLYDSDLYKADLSRADLESANLEKTNLQEADLRNANCSNANLQNANLEGAHLEDTDFDGAELGGAQFDAVTSRQVIALGRKTRAVSKLRKQALPLKAGAFKKLFPTEFEQVKEATKGADFTPELLRQLIERFGMNWHVTEGKYKSSAQRICRRYNDVLQLNVAIDDPAYSLEQRKIFENVKKVSLQSGHPVRKEPGVFTIGWVRYCDFDDRILIEEVQSDVGGVRKGLKDEEFVDELRDQGLSAQEIDAAMALLQPFADRFYEDAMGMIFDMAEDQGKKVEMLEYEHKKKFGSPESVYTKLPKSMGMKLGPSEAMPDLGTVWTYTPNRRRRRS